MNSYEFLEGWDVWLATKHLMLMLIRIQDRRSFAGSADLAEVCGHRMFLVDRCNVRLTFAFRFYHNCFHCNFQSYFNAKRFVIILDIVSLLYSVLIALQPALV